ncbi:MAG TPA: phosphoribosylanthranilate isomerase [Proteobacteria bacterium]|nr:N-(5'-phosphoribosyl)anthranilate isomerase [bacterium BMS3Abin14]HDL53591.1 phosphoribosylanthranilate isomerase [Pseudomonadota bacterium]
MKPSLKIKICGFTRVEDALEACALGVDLLGFNFVPGSSRYLSPYTARAIFDELPPFVDKVGIFAGEEVNMVNDLFTFLDLDALQLHGDEDMGYCRKIKAPFIKAVRVGGPRDLEGLEDFGACAYLLDARVAGELGGTGAVFNWDHAVDACRKHRIFIAGGLSPDNVGRAVRKLSPYGIDAASGVESSPGIKDSVLMERFVREARCASMGNGGGCRNVAC